MLCYVLWFDELQEQPRALQIKLFSISILRPDLFPWLLLEIERFVRWINVQNSFYIYSIWLSTYLPTSYFIQQSSWRLKGLAQGPRGNSLTVERFEHSAGQRPTHWAITIFSSTICHSMTVRSDRFSIEYSFCQSLTHTALCQYMTD